MTTKEFVLYVKGVIDSETINNPLSPPLRLIKDALDKIDYNEPFEKKFVAPINVEVPDMVPYHTVCSCSKENGGSGMCFCVMGNKMVPNPKKYPSTVGTTTTLNPDIKLGPRLRPPFEDIRNRLK